MIYSIDFYDVDVDVDDDLFDWLIRACAFCAFSKPINQKSRAF